MVQELKGGFSAGGVFDAIAWILPNKGFGEYIQVILVVIGTRARSRKIAGRNCCAK